MFDLLLLCLILSELSCETVETGRYEQIIRFVSVSIIFRFQNIHPASDKQVAINDPPATLFLFSDKDVYNDVSNSSSRWTRAALVFLYSLSKFNGGQRSDASLN